MRLASRLVLCAVLAASAALAAETATLTFEEPQTAGMSGLRVFWDRPVVLAPDGATEENGRGSILKGPMAIWAGDLGWHRHLNYWHEDRKRAEQPRRPGATCFDAVHRSLLVRFPGAAASLAAQMAKGYAIAKAQLVLPFKGTEKMSRGYKEPTSFIHGIWDKQAPRWHAVAWALRQPWQAHPESGPTFNASIHGAAYWTKYGAQDGEHDRFPIRFGPAEVSSKAAEPLDVTKALTDAAFGATPAARLRTVEDCGFLVRKWETYDAHFTTPGYEWASMTGSRGIFIESPKLVVVLRKDPAAPKPGALPPAPDLAKLKGGAPTAVLPTPEKFAQLRARYGFKRPTWMPDWQWARVEELYRLGGRANTFPDTVEDYQRWVDAILATQPRRWEGFSAADQLSLFYTFQGALPAPVADHWHLYWTAWLNPHMATQDMVHNQYHQIWTKWRPVGSDYADRTGDWRGNSSYYRESYTRIISTMNFNHTAALGALLGGRFIGSERAMADGRFGLEHFPLRLWAWYDGTTQESIDHYYFAITLQAQKMFADFAPTRFDRMMGQSILLKSIEELAACYHPGLRRFISTSSRTGIAYPIQIQDGLQHILHTLSHEGTLTDLDRVGARKKDRSVIPVIGRDLRPRRVAVQTTQSPWAPDWLAQIVDRKPIPFHMTTTFRQWGAFRTEPRWKKSFLAHHYGMASIDLGNNVIQAMALWRRTDAKVARATDLGLLNLRYGFNKTNLLDTSKGGVLGIQGGGTAIVQHRNKMVVLTSPYDKLKSHRYKPEKTEIRSLQTTLGLHTIQPEPTWTVTIDGKPVAGLPARAKASSRIAIEDGATYIGIIPIPATDLGRDAEILLHTGDEPIVMQGGGKLREKLLIESYNFRQQNPLDQKAADWPRIDAAYGGFIIELGDRTEHASFQAFQKHIQQAALSTRWEKGTETLHLAYKSGGDTIEVGYRPRQGDGPGDKLPASRYFPYRRVNGTWPYLPEGVDRETPLSIQGRLGRLEKNGAVLTLEPGQMGYLLTEPTTGTFLAANPLPDPTYFRFRLPGDVVVEADGKLGLARIVVRPSENKVWVDYAVREDQQGEDMATALLVYGLGGRPTVVRNGEPLLLVQTTPAQIVPLAGNVAIGKVLARHKAARAAAEKAFAAPKAAEQAVLRYESKQEHYLLTRPRSGAFAFQRLWPGPTAFEAKAPGGLRVAADGRLALRRLVLDPARNHIEVDAPRYLQVKFEEKATALLVFAPKRPTVLVNGRPCEATLPTADIAGARAWVVPLYGADPKAAAKDIAARYAAAMARLANP